MAPLPVLAVSAQGPSSPAFRVRATSLAGSLRRAEVELTPVPLFDARQERRFRSAPAAGRARALLRAREDLRRRLAAADACTVLVQRQVDLLPSLALERAATDGRRVVLDVDDAIWIDGPASGGHPLARLKRTERKLRWLAGRADVVMAGNALLAEHLAGAAADVRVVPSIVDVERQPVRRHDDREEVTLGWIGSATTAPYLAQRLPQLARARSARRARVLVVGGDVPDVPGLRIERLPWSEDAERAALQTIDIGLMPLPDTAWTRGKCAYKALQYMAAGIPVLADDVGVSAAVIGHDAAGLIAQQPADWAGAADALAADARLRDRLGAAGRARVTAGFSHERWIPDIAAILRGG